MVEGQNNVEYWLVLESVKERKAKTEYLLFYVAQQSTSACYVHVKGFCPPRQGPFSMRKHQNSNFVHL